MIAIDLYLPGLPQLTKLVFHESCFSPHEFYNEDELTSPYLGSLVLRGLAFSARVFYLDLPAIDVMQIDRFSGEQLRHVVVESDSTSNL